MESRDGKADPIRQHLWLWLIRVIGVIVPRRLRADWRQEWEAELRCQELLLADWDKLNWRTKLNLVRRSLGAFWDALLLQPQRLEDEMFQDLRFGLRVLLKQSVIRSERQRSTDLFGRRVVAVIDRAAGLLRACAPRRAD